MLPKTYRVNLLPRAKADLAEAMSYVYPDSPQNAAASVRRLLDAAASLSMFPLGHRVFRPNPVAARVVRSMPCPPYVIYFRVRNRAAVVDVVSIRHGARLPPHRF